MDSLPGRHIAPVEEKQLTLRDLHRPVAVGDIPFPDMKGESVLATADNMQALIKAMGINVCYDVIQKRLRWLDVKRVSPDESDYDMLCAVLESEAARQGLPQSAINRFLSPIANLSPFNAPLEYLESLPQSDIADPIGQLVEGAGLQPPDWARVCVTRWLIQACAAADSARRSIDSGRPEYGYVLTLAGDQGIAKTSLLYNLVPEPIRVYFSSGRTLDLNNKDSKISAISGFIVELGELDATFKKSDIAAMKAFLTNQFDEIRMPYARDTTRFSRRTVFAATVNHAKFLTDDTGNRRFWPVTVTKKMVWPEELADAIWAKAWELYIDKNQWWLTPQEEDMHAAIVAGFEDKPLQDRVLDCYDFDAPERPLTLTGTDILEQINWPNTDRGAATTLGQALKTLGVARDRQRRYLMPPRRGISCNL